MSDPKDKKKKSEEVTVHKDKHGGRGLVAMQRREEQG